MSSPIFPAIKAEILVMVLSDESIRVVSDWQTTDLDTSMIFALAILQMLVQAQKFGGDPAAILENVIRLTGGRPA